MHKLIEAANLAKPSNVSDTKGYLVLEHYNATLCIKRMSIGETRYNAVFELSMSIIDVGEMLYKLRELLREGKGTAFVLTDKYDIEMSLNFIGVDDTLCISIQEKCGQEYKPIKQAYFSKYDNDRDLIDGIQRFIERHERIRETVRLMNYL